MNRLGHQTGAVAAALTVATVTGMPATHTAVFTAAAAATSTLPDIDQTKPWRLLDRIVPDELLGAGGPLDHRGASHWWGWPAAAFYATWSLTGMPGAVVHGLVFGVAAHIVLDAGWGRPGVPVAPWWWYAGVSARNDSLSAVLATAVFAVVSAWLTVTLALNLPADPRWLLP